MQRLRSVSAGNFANDYHAGLTGAGITNVFGVRGYVSAERFTRTGVESVTTYSVASGTDGVREHRMY